MIYETIVDYSMLLYYLMLPDLHPPMHRLVQEGDLAIRPVSLRSGRTLSTSVILFDVSYLCVFIMGELSRLLVYSYLLFCCCVILGELSWLLNGFRVQGFPVMALAPRIQSHGARTLDRSPIIIIITTYTMLWYTMLWCTVLYYDIA